MTKELLLPRYNGLNPAGRFEAYLKIQAINYFENQWRDLKEETTVNTDIATAINKIKKDTKYQEN